MTNQDKELNNLTPEEQLQAALDQMMKKNYDKSKVSLEGFIENFPENQLSGFPKHQFFQQKCSSVL